MPTWLASSLLLFGWAPMLAGLRRRGPGPAPPFERGGAPGAGRDLGGAERPPGAEPRFGGRFDDMLVVLTWCGCIALTALAQAGLRWDPDPGRAAWGVGLFAAGIALWCAARAVHGMDYAQIARPPRALATRGPYRVVRHPLYLGTGLAAAGQALAAGQAAGVGTWLALAALLAFRARREEHLLARTHPADWERYSRRVRW